MQRIAVLVALLAIVAGACSTTSESTESTTTELGASVAPEDTSDPSGQPSEDDGDDAAPTTVGGATGGDVTEPTIAPGGGGDAGSGGAVSGDLPPPVVPGGDQSIDPGLQPFIDLAIADLAQRLGVGADAIEARAAYLVVWPDTSLGCPQPGMQYLQVLTDGSVIVLAADDAVYRYHTGGDRYQPFLCTTPATSAPSKEEGTVTITIPPPTDDKGGGDATEGTGADT